MSKENHPVPTPGVFTRTYKSSDGTIHTWYFNHKKMDRGPFKVEIEYPKGYTTQDEDVAANNKKLPLTKRTWINPDNGKAVGYARAKSLGLIKPDEK